MNNPSHEAVEKFRNYLVDLIDNYTEKFIGFCLNPEKFEKKPDFKKEGNALRLLVSGFMDCLVCHDYIEHGDLTAGLVAIWLGAMLNPDNSVQDYQTWKKAYLKAVDDFCEYLLKQ